MKRLSLPIILLTLTILLAQNAGATIWHIADSTNPDPVGSWGGVPSDANSGKDWWSAWASLSKLNSSVSGGDTVLFSTGIWRTPHDAELYPAEGTYRNHTIYACSTWVNSNAADTNANGEYHYSQIWGSTDMSSGHTVHSGNIYRKTGVGTPASDAILFQNDTVMLEVAGVSGLSEGKWCMNADTLFVYVHDLGSGYDPSNYTLEMSGAAWVDLDHGGTSNGRDYVTIYGFRMKYCGLRGIEASIYSMETDPYDSVFIDHCHLSHGGGWHGANPSLIHSGYGDASPVGRWNRVRACSLGYCYSTNNSVPQNVTYSNKGSAINHYKQRDYTIDSCTFYGYFHMAAIWWKCAHNPPTSGWSRNNTMAYNFFSNYNGPAIMYFGAFDSSKIYGNVAVGVEDFCIERQDDAQENPGHHQIYNNTLINCGYAFDWRNTGGATRCVDDRFQYNVCYESGDQFISIRSIGSSSDNFVVIDNNIYWTGGTFTPYIDGVSNTWAEWQTAGADANSTNGSNTAEDFAAAPANLDNISSYAMAQDSLYRPGNEMDTTYGGQAWAVYGAIQPREFTVSTVSDTVDSLWAVITCYFANDSGHVDSALLYWDQYQPPTTIRDAVLSGELADPFIWDTLAGLNYGTTYYAQVIAWDSAGQQDTSNVLSFTTLDTGDSAPPDTLAPSISGVSASGINASVATINWGTDESATSQVDYGLTTGYGQSTTLDGSLVLNHSVDLVGLDSGQTYHYRVRSSDQAGNERVSGDYTVTTLDEKNFALGSTVTVSDTYSGYSSAVITDGVLDPTGETATTWASSESSTQAHWVEIDFGQLEAISEVVIHWAWNSSQSAFMTSQQYYIESWNGVAWDSLAYVTNSAADSSTATTFNDVNTSRIRIYQPANMGPASYPVIMWLSEIHVFGGDTTPPAAIDDLKDIGWVPWHDITYMILGQSPAFQRSHVPMSMLHQRRVTVPYVA